MAERWQPIRFKRFEKRLDTSMGTARIVTEGGKAYIKCLGNREGPHCLACEWVGSRVAKVLGLPTFDFRILKLTDDDVPFDSNGTEEAGPAFISRAEKGIQWDRSEETLEQLENPEDIAKLIVLDTLLANWDRRSPSGDKVKEDNVFLSQERSSGSFTLVAMDFSHCIGRAGTISAAITHIARIRDDGVYGLFDAFVPFLDRQNVKVAVQSLDRLTNEKIEKIVSKLPAEWEIDDTHRAYLQTYLQQRRDYLKDNLERRISVEAGLQTEEDLETEE